MPHIFMTADVPDMAFSVEATDLDLTPDLLTAGPVVSVQDDDVRITTNNEVRITPETYIRTVGTQAARSVTSIALTPKDVD